MTTTSAPTRTSVAVWFELPANDFERAVAFYETIFATTLRREYFGEDMAIFPYEQPGISGAIVARPGQCGTTGPLLFLNADGGLDAILARVLLAGGEIVDPKAPVAPGLGWSATIIDPEGNRIGLHAMC